MIEGHNDLMISMNIVISCVNGVLRVGLAEIVHIPLIACKYPVNDSRNV